MSTGAEQKKQRSIKPQPLAGFRDILPPEAIARQEMLDKIRQVYERFGFVPLKTPVADRLEALVGSDTAYFNKSIFLTEVKQGLEDRGVRDTEAEAGKWALRFDLTNGLARLTAAYPKLVDPILRRYEVGEVFRGEKPQKGRYRQFTQFDFDTIGVRSILADVEVIQIMYETMRALGLKSFVIKVNTRKLLNDMIAFVGCAEKAKEAFRIIDKLDDIGADGVKTALQREPDNEFDESALALSDKVADKILSFLQIRGDSPDSVISQLEEFFGDTKSEGVAELKEITKQLRELDIPERFWRLDISVARGLDYYTGPVFETVTLKDGKESRSVFAGGRFDGLADRFMPGSNIAGVGASVGVDRLFDVLLEEGLLETKESLADVLVTIFDADNPSPSVKFAAKLRQAGINTETYLGIEKDRTMRGQIAYAVKRSMKFAIIIGPDEAAQGKVALKDLDARTQEVLTEDECIAKIRAVLSGE